MRRGAINLILITLIAGSLVDIVLDDEHWPFSQYPMFSVAWTSPSFVWLRVFGVDRDGREFPLDANRYIEPFDQSRLPKAFRRMLEQPDGSAVATTALHDVWRRYDALRLAGRHDGPPLAAMRLYELEWTIDRQAANLDRPDRRHVVAEARAEVVP